MWWKWHYDWNIFVSENWQKMHTFPFMHVWTLLGIVSRYIKLVKVCYCKPTGSKSAYIIEETPFIVSKFVDSWGLSITPSILSFPDFPLFRLHAVFLACFFIWNLCRPLRGTDSFASILSRLDVMCGLSSSADAIPLRSPAVWLHSTIWGGNEGLSEPLAIPLFSLSSPLAWD